MEAPIQNTHLLSILHIDKPFHTTTCYYRFVTRIESVRTYNGCVLEHELILAPFEGQAFITLRKLQVTDDLSPAYVNYIIHK